MGLIKLFSRSHTGTSGYNAINNAFTVDYDVYSFGVILLLVVCTKDKKTIFDKFNRLESQDSGESKRADSEKFIDVTPGTMDIYDLVHRFPVEKMIDPVLVGNISQACWEVFINIAERCLKQEPTERPTMGEVEVELEHSLAKQEEADASKTSDYILHSSTIFNDELE